MKSAVLAIFAILYVVGCRAPQIEKVVETKEASPTEQIKKATPKVLKTQGWKDVRVEEYEGRLVLANKQLQMEFAKGYWIGMKSKGVPRNMLAPVERAQAIDFMIDDTWVVEKHGARYDKHNVVINNMRK